MFRMICFFHEFNKPKEARSKNIKTEVNNIWTNMNNIKDKPSYFSEIRKSILDEYLQNILT